MIRAIVVDDEKLVRKGFISMIDWSSYGIAIVGDCGDGESALELLGQVEADLLFADITMPGMSGFDLIKQVRKRFPHMRSVVLTCHHEFDYVQEALRLGAIDYIVKTLLELDNVDETMLRIVERIKWEDRERPTVQQEQDDKRLSASSCLLFYPLTAEADSTELFRLPSVRRNPFIIMGGGGGITSLVHEPPKDELLKEIACLPRMHWQAALLFGAAEEPLDDVLHTLGATLAQEMYYAGTNDELPQLSYAELASKLVSVPFPNREKVDLELNFDLRWAFHCNDWDRLVKTVEQHRPTPGFIHHFAQTIFSEWNGLLYRQEDAAGLVADLAGCRNWFSLKAVLRRFADLAQRRMVELGFTKEVMVCLIRGSRYMKRYAGEKINQGDVAAYVNMSRGYFSQCFLKFAGVSFGDTLRRLRIERAKDLLLDTAVPVYEIAFMAGFEDERYFSKLFRERVGKLPSEFRADRG
ncbi:response regulator [Gorillibacterium massiliense]|uniref:response regulator n=1 Tax=Gorillibacterium massiliense TaxID=1280390 RepID=UPI0004BCB92E|nr:response regulator [Gorillibacterium massiliense]